MLNFAKIRKGAILSAFLTVLMVLTQIPFVASATFYEDYTGNYIIYEGAAAELDNIKYTAGGVKGTDFTVDIAPNATRYSNAISLKAHKLKANGWAEFSAKDAISIAGSVGIAMYVKLPNATYTSINFRMIDTDDQGVWGNFSAMPVDCKVTYVDPDNISNPIVKYEVPGASMPGWEGFIFVEFAELDENTDVNTNWDPANWNSNLAHIAISPYFDNHTSVAGTFYFDNIGFYKDVDSYIALANSKALANEVVFDGSSVNAFVNGCGNYYDNPGSGSQTDTGTAVQLSDFELQTVANPLGYGNAVSFKIPREGADGYLRLPIDEKAALANGKVRGLALYCELPDIDNPFIVELENVGVASAGIGVPEGCKITYISNDGIVTVKENSYPGSGMAGFKGFMFIDGAATYNHEQGLWSNFISGVISISDVQVRISTWHIGSAWAGKTYVIDNIGFYSDIQVYLDLLAKTQLTDNKVEKIAFTGDSISGVMLDTPTTVGQSFEQAGSDSTVYGSSISFYNTATGANCTGGVMFPLSGAVSTPAAGEYVFNKFDLSDANGIAFYLKVPERETTNMEIDILDMRWGDNTEGGFKGDANCRIADNPNITYYPLSGSSFTRNDITLSNIKGFEGFVFISFSEFSRWNYPLSNTSSFNYYDLNNLAIRFSPWLADGSSDVYKQIYISNIGFYSSPDNYMKAVRANAGIGEGKKGDITGDGTIDSADATQITRYYNGKTSMINASNPTMMMIADITGDGTIDSADATQITRFYNGKTSMLSN